MMFVFCLLGLMATARSVSAEVTRTEFTSKQPYGTFRVGDYVIWQGRIHGDLLPQEAIPGIDKAARNDRGRVPYSARIILIMPAANRSGNGALLVDVPNRGRVYAEALYNSPREAPFVSGTLEQGTGFLQDHGFTVAEVYWELGQGADLPSFVDADGRTRYVEGAGFAILRDAADFLAHAAADTAGMPNPLKGAINRTLASGKSQDGRFLKTFLLSGFNMAGNRRAFDGMHVFVSAAGLLPILQTGTGPESSGNGIPTFATAHDRRDHCRSRGAERGPAEDAADQLDYGLLFAARLAGSHGRIRDRGSATPCQCADVRHRRRIACGPSPGADVHVAARPPRLGPCIARHAAAPRRLGKHERRAARQRTDAARASKRRAARAARPGQAFRGRDSGAEA